MLAELQSNANMDTCSFGLHVARNWSRLPLINFINDDMVLIVLVCCNMMFLVTWTPAFLLFSYQGLGMGWNPGRN